jgi:CBS domain-containing protein
MDEHDIGRLLVVDEENKDLLLGIITRSDIMHALRT